MIDANTGVNPSLKDIQPIQNFLPEIKTNFQLVEDATSLDATVFTVDVYSDESEQEKVQNTLLSQLKTKQILLSDEWRQKGEPLEQFNVSLPNHSMEIHNYAHKELTPIQLENIRLALSLYSSVFPDYIKETKYILISDEQKPSVYGDEERYPYNGNAFTKGNVFVLMPRLLDDPTEWRFDGPNINPLAATIIHELSHIGAEEELTKLWGESGYKNESVDLGKYFFLSGTEYKIYQSKSDSGKIINAHNSLTLNRPEESVSSYATADVGEDIGDSMAVFLLQSESLKNISETKFKILSEVSQKQLEESGISGSEAKITKREKVILESEGQQIKYRVVHHETKKPTITFIKPNPVI